MKLLREDPEFRVAIQNAARDLGDLDPAFVEKDYWVTQILRALDAEYPHQFVFKGGTSLSKGYGIIERFSEDIDILVVRKANASTSDGERHLRAITGSVAAYVGLEWEESRKPGRGRDASRGDYLNFDSLFSEMPRTGVSPGSVLLETGYAGGPEPAEIVSISPMLCAPLGIDESEYEDTQAFQLRALEPRRTLIEKLFIVHHLATEFERGERPTNQRFGRHFHDIHMLLAHQPTLDRLKKDRDDFDRLVVEVERISQMHFGGTTPRPDSGFAQSPAFRHEKRGELRIWLEQQYESSKALLPGESDAPTFGAIMKRVEQYGEFL